MPTEWTPELEARLAEPFTEPGSMLLKAMTGQSLKASEAKAQKIDRCAFCGQYHEWPEEWNHLSYTEHAFVTDRLNDVLGVPDWRVVLLTTQLDGMHVLWVTGYIEVLIGTEWRHKGVEVGGPESQARKPGEVANEYKAAISDLIKRSAARWGVALDNWKKAKANERRAAAVEQRDELVQAERERKRSAGKPAAKPAGKPAAKPAQAAGAPDAPDGPRGTVPGLPADVDPATVPKLDAIVQRAGLDNAVHLGRRIEKRESGWLRTQFTAFGGKGASSGGWLLHAAGGNVVLRWRLAALVETNGRAWQQAADVEHHHESRKAAT
jgi:hypothetical protein